MRSSILLLCLALAGCSNRAPDQRGVDHDEVLLQVLARGEAESRPTEARFTVGVQSIGATAAAASASNNDIMARVMAAIQRLGVQTRDVQTKSLTLSRIEYGPNRGRYQANNMAEIRLRDVDRAGAAIAAAADAGANLLSGPNLVVGDPEAAARAAYARAFKEARARAETYAQAAGMKVSRVLAIRDAGGATPPIYHGDAAGAVVEQAAAVAPPPVAAGMNRNTVHVRVDFALAAL